MAVSVTKVAFSFSLFFFLNVFPFRFLFAFLSMLLKCSILFFSKVRVVRARLKLIKIFSLPCSLTFQLGSDRESKRLLWPHGKNVSGTKNGYENIFN